MAKKAEEPPKYPEIGARLTQFIQDSKEPSARQFAIRAGLAPQLISNLCGGYSMPSGETLVALASAYKGFDAMWLLTGKEPMLRDGRPLTRVEAPEPAEPRPDYTTAAGTLDAAYLSILKEQVTDLKADKARLLAENGDLRDANKKLLEKPFPSSDAADGTTLAEPTTTPEGPLPILSVQHRRRAGFRQQGASLD